MPIPVPMPRQIQYLQYPWVPQNTSSGLLAPVGVPLTHEIRTLSDPFTVYHSDHSPAASSPPLLDSGSGESGSFGFGSGSGRTVKIQMDRTSICPSPVVAWLLQTQPADIESILQNHMHDIKISQKQRQSRNLSVSASMDSLSRKYQEHEQRLVAHRHRALPRVCSSNTPDSSN
ncbi:hypothetical protein HK100_009970 [Physocladia obscura]|uniref:Uncharacterized protein n=1 Tax=Physocladia obscura TaxID=109957 RepID=A0AAD5T2X9_9FUNG|nr:hypothetical protein HK100_009970 [Physocladia obscura]